MVIEDKIWIDLNSTAPTKVYFGKKQETKVGEILEKSCYKKVLVHYGGNSAKKVVY